MFSVCSQHSIMLIHLRENLREKQALSPTFSAARQLGKFLYYLQMKSKWRTATQLTKQDI